MKSKHEIPLEKSSSCYPKVAFSFGQSTSIQPLQNLQGSYSLQKYEGKHGGVGVRIIEILQLIMKAKRDSRKSYILILINLQTP